MATLLGVHIAATPAPYLGVLLRPLREVVEIDPLHLPQPLEVGLVQRRLQSEGLLPVYLLPVDGTICAVGGLMPELRVGTQAVS